jgi:hypothetical protein
MEEHMTAIERTGPEDDPDTERDRDPGEGSGADGREADRDKQPDDHAVGPGGT